MEKRPISFLVNLAYPPAKNFVICSKSKFMRAARIIDQEIAQYLPRLNDQQKEAVLSVVKTFATEQKDWWDEISKEQQAAIDQSLVEMKAGKLTHQDDVLKKYKKWLKK
jgi:hypothetical protein